MRGYFRVRSFQINFFPIRPLFVVILPLFISLPVVAEAPPYEVVCEDEAGMQVCKVNKETYIGWRTFTASCLRCHGQDAVGSTFAPSLLERMNEIDKARFMTSLDEGYTGEVGVMPPWKDNPNVNKRYEELYAYLKARADGALPPGRPKRLDR